MELLPPGKRTSQQLWQVQSRKRHIRSSPRHFRPDAYRQDDGRRGRRHESKEEEERQEERAVAEIYVRGRRVDRRYGLGTTSV